MAVVFSSSRSPDEGETTPPFCLSILFPAHGAIVGRTMFGVALVYLLFNLVRVVRVPMDHFAIALVGVVAALLLTLLFHWILYRLLIVSEDGDVSPAIILLTLPSLALAIVAAYGHGWIMNRVGISSDQLNMFDLFFIHYLILAGWGGIYLALVQGKAIQGAIANSTAMEQQKRESELRALRFQLNPHFVFNALNSISSLVIDQRNAKAEKLIEDLADYMRDVLQDDGENMISVGQEIAQQVRYLEIEKIRFPHRLSFAVTIAEDVVNWKIPAFIIQPVIENAIKYGVAQATDPVCISISADQSAGRLWLRVANDGAIDGDETDIPGTGTGLNNVRDRLSAIYGPAAVLTTASRDNAMVVVSLIIPNEFFVFGKG